MTAHHYLIRLFTCSGFFLGGFVLFFKITVSLEEYGNRFLVPLVQLRT